MAREERQVLIVDDEDSLSFFLQQGLLEIDAGWVVDTAATGEEAVIKINRYSYGLIIADLRMPGLNGLELIQMVRALEPGTRVILMTGYGSDRVEEEARRLQVFRYIPKPFAMEEMQAHVRAALGVSGAAPGAKPGSAGEPELASEPELKPEPEPFVQVSARKEIEQERTEQAPVSHSEQIPEAAAAEIEPGTDTGLVRPAALIDEFSAQLAQLRFRSGARCLALAGPDVIPVAQAGTAGDVDVAAAFEVCARSLAEAREMAGGVESAFLIQRLVSCALCSVTVGDGWILMAIYDRAGLARRLENAVTTLLGVAEALGPLTEPTERPSPSVEAEIVLEPASPEAPPEPVIEEETPSDDEPAEEPIETTFSEWEDLVEEEDGDGDFFSLDQAKELGLIDDDLMAKLFGE
jgi:DNA-binding response OmpR family regulator